MFLLYLPYQNKIMTETEKLQKRAEEGNIIFQKFFALSDTELRIKIGKILKALSN